MRTFFLALLRCISLSLAFALATFSAAAFLTFVLYLDGDASWLKDDLLVAATTPIFFLFMWFTIAWLAFFPSCIITLSFEFAQIRSALSNILAGGAVALAAGFMPKPGNQPELDVLPYSNQQVLIAVLAAGFVAGFVFWLLAGHRAGNWLPQPDTDTEFSQ